VLLAPADALALDVHGRTQSAVLAPLYLDAEGELRAVFTKRREDLSRHPGEISFPGGRRDPGDRDLCRTALREAEEEVGLPPEGVELVGALAPVPTFVTDYAIYPFVGLIEPGFTWVLAEREVAQVLELRMRDIRAGHGTQRLVRKGLAFRTDAYRVGDHLIWGATARIVADLLRRLDEPASPSRSGR
jgi:8-oxo-dGTP pyrophosphatase MutT (NUDIX family)